eukprot:TRINITY_DN8125_c1_g1_i15.p1 TRINITY_DN8125_c1_g1~~TRINITY_DN8125_c1_g1_i15.p1  ORF type:complete len:327 (-),score=76.00 TRINITY_DN8125_c1_g1_i15:21-896(-)
MALVQQGRHGHVRDISGIDARHALETDRLGIDAVVEHRILVPIVVLEEVVRPQDRERHAGDGNRLLDRQLRASTDGKKLGEVRAVRAHVHEAPHVRVLGQQHAHDSFVSLCRAGGVQHEDAVDALERVARRMRIREIAEHRRRALGQPGGLGRIAGHDIDVHTLAQQAVHDPGSDGARAADDENLHVFLLSLGGDGRRAPLGVGLYDELQELLAESSGVFNERRMSARGVDRDPGLLHDRAELLCQHRQDDTVLGPVADEDGQIECRQHPVEIGRAVQQECRDRSRMPSSA